MKVYLDIILIENLLMNYIILFATGIAMKRRIKNYRIIISSIVGSIYAVIIYLKIINVASNIFMKFILSIAMVWLAFGAKRWKALLKDLLMFYVISFVFGGCAFALIYFIKPENVKIRNGVLTGVYPLKVTLFASGLAFVAIQIAFKITKNKLSTQDMLCKVEIYIESDVIKLKALIDSGNMLKDPISHYPVIVVEKEKIEKELNGSLKIAIENIKGGEEVKFDNKYVSKLRLIPFSSIGKQNGMLVGIKADGAKIIFGEKEIYVKNVIVGIYTQKMQNNNRYNALIGLDLLDGSDNNESFANIKGEY